jgi:hypothetical protein
MGIINAALAHYVETLGAIAVIALLTVFWNLVARTVTFFVRIKVSGQWETTLDRGTGPTRHEEVTLHQFIHRVWGHSKTQGRETYKLQGTLTGDRLCLIYRAIHGGSDTGASLLKIKVTGDEMEGRELGVDRDTNAFYSYPYVWKKKK